MLPNFGTTAQSKLSESKVLVVGAGGLGVPVLQYLAAAGIGEIGIADGDLVALNNLHRQVLYSEADIGKNKAIVAKEKLEKLNSGTKLNVYDFFISPEVVFEILEHYDVVVDCTDDFSIRYLLNDVCYLLNKPLVFSSIYQFEAQISVFHYGENPFNLRDIFPEIPDEGSVPNCNEAGVLGTLAGIAGCLQANETIKILTQIGHINSGRLLLFNSLNNSTCFVNIHKNKTSFLPQSKEDVLDKNYGFSCFKEHSIDHLETLEKMINQNGSILIDVRDPEETPKIMMFPVLEIPLSELPKRIQALEKYSTLIFICKSGKRSKKAFGIAKKQYKEKIIYHIEKGIEIFEHERNKN